MVSLVGGAPPTAARASLAGHEAAAATGAGQPPHLYRVTTWVCGRNRQRLPDGLASSVRLIKCGSRSPT